MLIRLWLSTLASLLVLSPALCQENPTPISIQELLREATVVEAEDNVADIRPVVEAIPVVEVAATTPEPVDQDPISPLRQRFRLRNRNRPPLNLRPRPRVINTNEEEEKPETTTSRSSLFAPRRRFRPRVLNRRPVQNNEVEEVQEEEVTSTTTPSTAPRRSFTNLLRRPRPTSQIFTGLRSRTTTEIPKTTTTTATTTVSTTTTTVPLTTTEEITTTSSPFEVETTTISRVFEPTAQPDESVTSPPIPALFNPFGNTLAAQRATTRFQARQPVPTPSAAPVEATTSTRFQEVPRRSQRPRVQNRRRRPVPRTRVTQPEPIPEPQPLTFGARPLRPKEPTVVPLPEPERKVTPVVTKSRRPFIQLNPFNDIPLVPLTQPQSTNTDTTPTLFVPILTTRQRTPRPQTTFTTFETSDPTTAPLSTQPITNTRVEVQPTVEVEPTPSAFENTVPDVPVVTKSRHSTIPRKFKVTRPTKTINPGSRIKVEDRYRVQNDDGSITWGYKSADGSFKEETIGADCITRGRYGYVDPVGRIREFKYESGIACDPRTKQPINQPKPDTRIKNNVTPTRESKAGYFDYRDNKFVLPDGRRVKVVVNKKNRARG